MKWIRERLPVIGTCTVLLFMSLGAIGYADGWYGSFVRDANYYLDVNCKTGCSTSGGSTANPNYTRIQDGTSTTLLPVGNVGSSDSQVPPFTGITTGSYAYGYNGSTWDRMKAAANNADSVASVSAGSLFTNAFAFAFNGSGYDRVRTVTAQNAAFTNKNLAIGICDPITTNSNSCAQVYEYSNFDANSANENLLGTAAFGYGFNGATWDRLRTTGTGIQEVALCSASTGCPAASSWGTTPVNADATKGAKIAATTCTFLTSIGRIGRFWSAGTETATLTIYDEGASPTCTAADVVWSGVPSSTPITLMYPLTNGLTYKFSAAPAVNDYVTEN